MNISKIEETTLWKTLKNGATSEGDENAELLANNLKIICEQSYSRMKYFSSQHPQYTLHDETHFLRVTELMAKIIPEETLRILNPIEISLLILAAHFHDQGMIIENEELEELKDNTEFKVFKDTWIIDHPNYKEINNQLITKNVLSEEFNEVLKKQQELDGALLTDFIRTTHGRRSASYVSTNFSSDSLWNVAGSNLAESVSKLCKSHVQPVSDLSEINGYHYDDSIGGYQVNLIYIALILRLADILDFDRDRTPDMLYKTIHFSNDVSLLEWNKHRSVEGWFIDSSKVRFTMKCEHPAYEKAARQYMDWIDEELYHATSLVNKFPAFAESYKLNLPQSVDRSRIQPKDNQYIYHDLEFNLSRDEIVKLLLTENLYKSSSLCIRELLQNSLDALRYRKAQFKRDSQTEWNEGKVEFVHSLDEHDREIIICNDNGIGMDINVITKFLTNAGRSYYRSPEFERERISLAERNVDFDPCAQFGIGFMSSFMLGDEIVIKTRKDYGQNREGGTPLIVEINGLSGMIVIKEGESSQAYGTSVKIVSRKKPDFFDSWVDKVKLIEVLDGYALATEFPIKGSCDIPEIRDSINVPTSIYKPKTFLEVYKNIDYVTLEQNMEDFDENIKGYLRTSFLIDKDNKINIANDQVKWESDPSLTGFDLRRIDGEQMEYCDKKKFYNRSEFSSICLDGILVSGNPGRTRDGRGLGWVANQIHLERDSYNIDIRGKLKPSLTPERIPPTRSGRLDHSWRRIEDLLFKAQGRLWSSLLNRLNEEYDDGIIFWKLAAIYKTDLTYCSFDTLYNKVFYPIRDLKGTLVGWKKACDLKEIEPEFIDGRIFLKLEDGNYIGISNDLRDWDNKEHSSYKYDDRIATLLLSMSFITKKNEKLIFEIREPHNLNDIPSEWILKTMFSNRLSINYSSHFNNLIGIDLLTKTLNATHPLVKIAIKTSFSQELSNLEQFAGLIVNNYETLRDSNGHGRFLRSVGFSYKSIDWGNIDSELKPPYSFINQKREIMSLTEEDFLNWATLTVKETENY